MLEQTNTGTYQSDPDEISIRDIFSKLWAARGIFVVMPLIFGGLSLATVMMQQVRVTPAIEFYISLIGIEKSNYPNGTKFSVQDLVSPEVISAVAEKYQIENTNDLLSAFNVNLSSPSTSGIIKKYQTTLAQPELTAVQLDDVNKQFKEELNSSTNNTVRITLDYASLNLPKTIGKDVTLALPKMWAEIYTTKYRILDSTRLQGHIIDTEIALDTSFGSLEGSRALAAISQGATVIQNDSRLALLQTSQKITAADLRQISEDFDNVYMSAILNLNLKESDTLTRFYVNDIKLGIEQVDERITGMQQTINDISDIMAGQRIRRSTDTASPDSIEITGDALDEIVSLAKQASLSSYLTSLFDIQAKLINERSKLRIQLRKITETSVVPTATFMTQAQQRFEHIVEQYNELLTLARAMNKRNNAMLYRPIGSPIEAGGPLPRRAILTIVLGILIGGLVATLYALARPAMRVTKDAT